MGDWLLSRERADHPCTFPACRLSGRRVFLVVETGFHRGGSQVEESVGRGVKGGFLSLNAAVVALAVKMHALVTDSLAKTGTGKSSGLRCLSAASQTSWKILSSTLLGFFLDPLPFKFSTFSSLLFLIRADVAPP